MSLEIWTDLVDFSTFVDRYEKGGYYRDVCCLQFSPNGQLLATGTDGGEINVRSLGTSFSVDLMRLGLDMGHRSKSDENQVQRTYRHYQKHRLFS